MPLSALSAATIRAALTTRWLGRSLVFLAETGSTNADLRRLAENGAPAGTLVITEHQTAGRGRLDRRWEAPAGSSLLLSLLFRPDWPPERAAWLTMLGGLAACAAVPAVSAVPLRLKWPNDLVVLDHQTVRKAGGLLLEGSFRGGRIDHVILGLGLNVNLSQEQLPEAATPATSLLIERGQPVDRLALLGRLLAEMETRYATVDEGLSPHQAWEALLVTRDRPVSVTLANGDRLEGLARGTDEQGRLLVELEGGRQQAVAAGEVTLRPPSG